MMGIHIARSITRPLFGRWFPSRLGMGAARRPACRSLQQPAADQQGAANLQESYESQIADKIARVRGMFEGAFGADQVGWSGPQLDCSVGDSLSPATAAPCPGGVPEPT